MHFRSQNYVGLVTLTFHLETVAQYRPWVNILPTIFGVSATFCSRLFTQNRPDASRDLATLTFDLGGHGWCGFSCSVCVKFTQFKLRIGFPVRKILRIYYVSINRPGDLDLWPSNWCAISPVDKQPSYQFRCFWDVSFLTYRPKPVRASRDLATLTFEVTALVADAGLRTPSEHQVWSS